MELNSDYHHEACPVCGQRLIGFTDADMITHFIEEHPDYGHAVATKLGIPQKKTKTCGSCGKEYVTIQGECPWCVDL